MTEIRERAERLNKNLALPELDPIAEPSRSVVPEGPDRLKRSVIRLGTFIFSFVDNPFFKEISVVDTQQTAKARRDLGRHHRTERRNKKDQRPEGLNGSDC